MRVITTNQLTLSYGPRRGIRDVALQISEGAIFGFLGPNGAGKTTSIRVLLGFLRAHAGSAQIFGRDCWTNSHVIKQDVGYVAGDVRLYPWLTARRALRIVGGIRGRNLMNAGLQLSERFRLEPDLAVRRMSRGNRQKLALVLALAHQPRLVILDEPTSGLDPLMQETLYQCLREMAQDGRTVFFSSHTLSEVESLCDHVAMIRDGEIVVDESLESLKQRAPRSVTVTLQGEVNSESISWPGYLTHRRQFRRTHELQMSGSARDFLQWAAVQPFDDVTIGPPALEVLFRDYYDDTTSSAQSAVRTARAVAPQEAT